MQSCQCFWKPLIVFGEAVEPCRPRERPLHYPAVRQKHKVFPGLGQFDHRQLHAVFFGRFGRWS